MTEEDRTQDERAPEPEPDPAELLRARMKHLAAKLKARGLIKSDDVNQPQDRDHSGKA